MLARQLDSPMLSAWVTARRTSLCIPEGVLKPSPDRSEFGPRLATISSSITACTTICESVSVHNSGSRTLVYATLAAVHGRQFLCIPPPVTLVTASDKAFHHSER